jgi:hypothetical protein
MSKFTRLMVTSSFAAGFLALSMGVAPAATPGAATTNWSHAELTKSQITEVRKNRRWGNRRYGKRYGYRRYGRRGYYRPYRYGYYGGPRVGVWGPGFGVYVGPRHRYRYG